LGAIGLRGVAIGIPQQRVAEMHCRTPEARCDAQETDGVLGGRFVLEIPSRQP